MKATVRLIRRYPSTEAKKTKSRRKRWVWVLRWYDKEGIRRGEAIGYWCEPRDNWKPRGRTGRMTAKEASRVREAKQAKLGYGRPKPKPLPIAAMRWDNFVEQYVRDTKGTIRDSSLIALRRSLTCFGKIAGPKTPFDVNSRMVKRFVQARRSAGVRDATIHQNIALLKRTWNAPATKLAVNGNPFKLGKSIRLKIEPKEWHRYMSDELQKILTACPDLWWRMFVFTVYTTALRVGELANLQWVDVDFKTLEVHVRPRQADAAHWAWVPKGAYRRTVPLTGHTVAILQRLHLTRDPENPYVFVRADRYREIQDERTAGRWHSMRAPLSSTNYHYKRLLGRAGVTVDAFHSLRKSCITN